MPSERPTFSHSMSGTVEGILLAGGDSRRMGRDKAWLELGGRPVIERVADAVRDAFPAIRLITNRSSSFRELGIPIQPDLRPGSGPLGGIHAALRTTSHPVVCVVACDLPFVSSSFLRALGTRLEDHDAVVPRERGVPVPTCAYYRVSCLAAVESRLDEGRLEAAGFLDGLDVRWLDEPELRELDPRGLALFNLNAPEDLERAKRLLASS